MDVRALPVTEPMIYARRLRHRPKLAVLDSAMRHRTRGRYSVVACDPFGWFEVRGRQALWNGEPIAGNPLDALRQLLGSYRQSREPDLPPFQGGALGFLTYEFGRDLQTPPTRAPESACPRAMLGFYDSAVAIDHVEDRAWLVSTGWPERDPAGRAVRATQRADQFESWLADEGQREPDAPAHTSIPSLAWRSTADRQSYGAAVRRVVDYILAGDVFQANIAQRFQAACPPAFDHMAFYERLRSINTAPFGAYLQFGDIVVASSSPERFLSLNGDQVETRPIKGTAPRGADPASDARRLARLLASEKDRAENVMIVDLLRNDLSKVCRPHSVKVPELCRAETYASLHHLVSVVTGRLADGRDAIDLLAACLPGGSITGAPKVRAMEIIAEIEGVPRDVYCGAIGFLGFHGSMDTNVAIRTVAFQDGLATVHAGGGITLLSDPDAEYDETLVKAGRIFAAFDRGEP